MKIAVTDACIFIDLHELMLTTIFFSLPFEIHSTLDVLNELYEEHRILLQAFISSGLLTIHVLTDQDRQKIHTIPFPLSLSEADRSTLFIAERLEATLLSSDKAVRRYAKNKSIPYHGMLWIFDQLVESGILPTEEAAKKLNLLVSQNLMYQNNAELLEEAAKRIKKWI